MDQWEKEIILSEKKKYDASVLFDVSLFRKNTQGDHAYLMECTLFNLANFAIKILALLFSH